MDDPMTKQDREIVIEKVKEILLNENLSQLDIDSIQIVIPPHKNSLGMNTTLLYQNMPSVKQYAHSARVTNMGATQWSAGPRETRQQDVVVEAVGSATDKRWRADTCKDKKSHKITITLSLQKKPTKVIKRLVPQLIEDLEFLMKCVTSQVTQITTEV